MLLPQVDCELVQQMATHPFDHARGTDMLHTLLPKVAKWALDLTLLAGGFCLAFLCRFEGAMTMETIRLMFLALPITGSVLLALRFAFLLPAGMALQVPVGVLDRQAV
jgi:hypothetical protein